MIAARCLVLGGAGFVGSGIVAALREAGWEVAVAGRDDWGTFAEQPFDVLINANGNAKRFLANRDPVFDFEASVLSVYRSLFQFQFQRYVYVSTVDVYNDVTSAAATVEDVQIQDDQLHTYGFHKRLAEICVQRHGPRWLIVRLGQMVGPGLKKGPLFDLLNAAPLHISKNSRMPFLHTHNVGRAIKALLDQGVEGTAVNICGRGSVDFARVCELFDNRQAAADNAAETTADAPTQTYEISVEKVGQWFEVPDSMDELNYFVREATSGGV